MVVHAARARLKLNPFKTWHAAWDGSSRFRELPATEHHTTRLAGTEIRQRGCNGIRLLTHSLSPPPAMVAGFSYAANCRRSRNSGDRAGQMRKAPKGLLSIARMMRRRLMARFAELVRSRSVRAHRASRKRCVRIEIKLKRRDLIEGGDVDRLVGVSGRMHRSLGGQRVTEFCRSCDDPCRRKAMQQRC